MGACGCHSQGGDVKTGEGGDQPEILKSPDDSLTNVEKEPEKPPSVLLHSAILAGNAEDMSAALDKGAGVEDKDDAGLTPLQQAIFADKTDLGSVLLDKGANVEVVDSKGQTLLLYAVEKSHVELVKLLVQKGAAVKMDKNDDGTPLLVAVKNHNSEIATFLVESAADKSVVNQKFLQACQQHELEEAEFLLSCGAEIDAVGEDGSSAVIVAVLAAQAATVTKLAEKGADLNKKSSEGKTALFMAVEKEDMDMVKLLIEKGANKDEPAKTGKTPIAVAVEKENIALGKLLAGSDANALGKKLLEACVKGLWKNAQFYVQLGASSKLKNKDGKTPLLLATEKVQVEVVELLLKHGADKSVTLKDGRSALIIAIDKGNHDLAKLFTAKLSNADKTALNKKLVDACAASKEQIVKTVIELGADPTVAKGSDGRAPIRIAVDKGNEAIVEVLAGKGGRLGGAEMEPLKDKFLDAAGSGNASLVRIYHKAGMSIETRDLQGERAIHRACQSGHMEVLKYCLDNKADIEVLGGANACSPLYFASIRGFVDMAKLLLERGANKDGIDEAGQDQYDKLMSGKNPYGYKPK